MTRHVARRGQKRIAYRILVGKPEGKSHWEEQDDIKMNLRLVEWYGFIWLRIGTSGGLL
jgi:hypothetical protein